jgi:DNA-binding LytR/AlgR family response regulator
MVVRNSLIIQNEVASLSILSTYIHQLPYLGKPDVCHTAVTGLAAITQQPYQIIFLDMHLPDMSGIELLKSLARPYPIVVTATDPAFAADCYDLNVADYLLHPVAFPRLVRAVNRVLDIRFDRNGAVGRDCVYLKVSRTIQRFAFQDIDFVEAFGIYTKIWHGLKATIVNETISSLESRLPAHQFMRIQKSYLVNLGKVSSYSFTALWIGPTKLPLGSAYRDKFEGYLTLLEGKF